MDADSQASIPYGGGMKTLIFFLIFLRIIHEMILGSFLFTTP